jgi:hypothetical protein
MKPIIIAAIAAASTLASNAAFPVRGSTENTREQVGANSLRPVTTAYSTPRTRLIRRLSYARWKSAAPWTAESNRRESAGRTQAAFKAVAVPRLRPSSATAFTSAIERENHE